MTFAALGPEDLAQLEIDLHSDPLGVVRTATEIARAARPAPDAASSRPFVAAVPALAAVAPSALIGELTQTLVGRDADVALEWLHAIGAMTAIFPEVAATVDLAQEAGRMHKDVWAHTKQVVKQAVPRPAVRWAALLHDIGKVPTRTFTAEGVHFHGHAEVGARMFDRIVRRVPFERDDARKIRFLIKHHLRSNQYSEGWTDSAVRRFSREMDAHLGDLLDLSRADITSKRPGRRQFLLHQISALSSRVDRLREEDARVPPLPPGVGLAIMEHFGLAPSRLIGDLKRSLEDAIAQGALEPRRDDAYYVAWLATSGLVPTATEREPGRPAGPDS
jgi:poly(A) polymerase